MIDVGIIVPIIVTFLGGIVIGLMWGSKNHPPEEPGTTFRIAQDGNFKPGDKFEVVAFQREDGVLTVRTRDLPEQQSESCTIPPPEGRPGPGRVCGMGDAQGGGRD